jgi:chemotaxis protein CheX
MSALAIKTSQQAPEQILSSASRAIMETAAREIFEIMLGLQLARSAAVDPPVVADVTVLVGFSGQWRGVFGLHCQAHTACRLATLALGADTDEFDERVLDAVGEIANMVAGSFKSKIPGLGENSFLSVPSVISGADYHRHVAFGGEHLEMSLSCEGSPIWLTLDLRK